MVYSEKIFLFSVLMLLPVRSVLRWWQICACPVQCLPWPETCRRKRKNHNFPTLYSHALISSPDIQFIDVLQPDEGLGRTVEIFLPGHHAAEALAAELELGVWKMNECCYSVFLVPNRSSHYRESHFEWRLGKERETESKCPIKAIPSVFQYIRRTVGNYHSLWRAL